MIKAIFFDIDGTLVNDHGKALESTKKGIALAQEKGILCGVATGRGPVQLSQQIDALNFDFFVTYNGQLVYTQEETIHAAHFSDETLNRIISFSDRYHRQIMFGSRRSLDGSSLMRFGQNKWAKRIVRYLPKYFPTTLVKNLISRFSIHRKEQRYRELEIVKEPIYQCVLLSPTSETQTLKEQLPDCHITRSNPYTVDIIPQSGSKLIGIQKCVEYFGFTLDEVLAFGDSWNDLEMLSGVGFGVAMGNAESEVKAIAKYVTQTNAKDGIYQAMKYYKII
ncbi:haloacid dehalogenase [Enterococcus ureilyticus]|uniref:Haloacid dehalogenase n=1 Tax=Enterococcus ureilyticus TaxID=1131292 RepID=A0A1E5HFC1_9ENTE|nr:Cof-type HAD-IIB family hydrolase [Enterococcus ureilyticus]MBM7689285.1 Cof subfamily protein (haloacid dehalogenase superfamily) [Enterococcus ureilyticus]MBO0446412.1 Cof-type HAD-IIB family hydrolase [Enterococcus ureilyticus]OEG23556.1 haloacid dehalogenase [Enterococcus ureilyticus]